MKRHIKGEGNTTMAIVEARTNSTYIDLVGSASLMQGSVSKEAHPGERAIP